MRLQSVSPLQNKNETPGDKYRSLGDTNNAKFQAQFHPINFS